MKDRVASFLVRVDSIPSEGRHFRFEPDTEARTRLAAEFDLAEIAVLIFEGDLKRLEGRRVSIKGLLTASVTQTDVVTLEPVANAVSEEVDAVLSPAEEVASPRKPDLAIPAEPDDPDVYRNGQVDLGALAVEHLVLGLNPYPRAPGVSFEPHVEDPAAPEESPFAALAQLKARS